MLIPLNNSLKVYYITHFQATKKDYRSMALILQKGIQPFKHSCCPIFIYSFTWYLFYLLTLHHHPPPLLSQHNHLHHVFHSLHLLSSLSTLFQQQNLNNNQHKITKYTPLKDTSRLRDKKENWWGFWRWGHRLACIFTITTLEACKFSPNWTHAITHSTIPTSHHMSHNQAECNITQLPLLAHSTTQNTIT